MKLKKINKFAEKRAKALYIYIFRHFGKTNKKKPAIYRTQTIRNAKLKNSRSSKGNTYR